MYKYNTMNNEQLAKVHLEMALKLVDKEVLRGWLDNTESPVVLPEVPAKKSNRGRRPGAASVEDRCSWVFTGGEQCKNTKKDGSHCKMHIKKAHLLEA